MAELMVVKLILIKQNGNLVNGGPLLPEVAADVLREGAAPGVRVLASHRDRTAGGRGRGTQRGSLVVVEGRRLGVVDHPHGAVIDGPGAEVVLPDSKVGENALGEGC